MAFSAHLSTVLLALRKLALHRMQNTVIRKDTIDHNHVFANNVRFLSMAAIIGIHTISSYPSALGLSSAPAQLVYWIQPLKFGTIGFFLVSGFLFGERIDQYSPLEYFRRRLRNIFLPWVVWFLMFCAMRIGANCLHGRFVGSYTSQVFTTCKACLFDTAFWFVPNLLIALAVLVFFGQFLNDVRIGLIFLAASLFYGANVYGHWFAVRHTHAAFGFVFFLWLGAWSSWHFQALKRFLSRIPTSVIIVLVLLAHMLALAESKILFALDSVDPMNTLRISNQLYSVLIVLAIVKLRFAVWPWFVDVRANTFGLYLTHTAVLALLSVALRYVLPLVGTAAWWVSTPGELLLVPIIFALAYSGCLGIVRTLLARPQLRWTIGLPVRKQKSVEKLATT